MDGGSILSVIGSLKQAHGDALNGRIDRAAGVWYAGGVSYLGGNKWLVDSRSRPGLRHEVRFNIKWTCDCEDCQRRAPEVEFLGGVQKTCLHILAAGISWLVDSPEATTRPAPAPALTLPAWIVDPDLGRIPTQPTAEYQRVLAQETARRAAHQDSADMGIDARDAAPPAWFGKNVDIESYLG